MGRSRHEWLWVGPLSVVAFVLAHDLIYLFTYGPDYQAALLRTGHGERWTITVLTVLALGAVLAVAGSRRLVELGSLARAVDSGVVRVQGGELADLGRHVGRLWLVIFSLALSLYVGRENVEHVWAGLPAPGLTVLASGGSVSTLILVGAVALLVAALAGLYRWRRDVLIARIAAARRRWARALSSPARRDLPWVARRVGSIAGCRLAGRAPPHLVLT